MSNCDCYDSDRKNYICNLCIEDQNDMWLWNRHTSDECGGCYYCTEEEHQERKYQRYHGFMYEGFVEQYGPDAVYNFILVKNELLDYFEKDNQQTITK